MPRKTGRKQRSAGIRDSFPVDLLCIPEAGPEAERRLAHIVKHTGKILFSSTKSGFREAVCLFLLLLWWHILCGPGADSLMNLSCITFLIGFWFLLTFVEWFIFSHLRVAQQIKKLKTKVNNKIMQSEALGKAGQFYSKI